MKRGKDMKNITFVSLRWELRVLGCSGPCAVWGGRLSASTGEADVGAQEMVMQEAFAAAFQKPRNGGEQRTWFLSPLDGSMEGEEIFPLN